MATILKAAARAASAPIIDPAPDRMAEAIRERARDEASSILETAHGEAEAIRTRARTEGRAAGVAEAVAAVAAAAAARDRMLAAAERDVVALGVAVARRLVAEAALDHAVAVESARLAVARARDRTRVTVRVNPEDAGAVAAARPPLAAAARGCSALVVVDDPSVPRGGAVVETEAGEIDACLESRFDALSRSIMEAVS